MNKAERVFKEVLARVRPSEQEKRDVIAQVNAVIENINRNLSGAAAVLGGSGAKGTWLKGVFDIDIFVLFDYDKFVDRSDALSDILEKALKKSFRGIERIHGSRDYFRLRKGNFTFEIVPMLKIRKPEKAKNMTDISPLHSAWVKSRADERLADEIRLLKTFCRAQGVYGAESHIAGFSGYVCEILIVYYGSLLKLLKACLKWKPKEVIDINWHYKDKQKVFTELNQSKLQSPIIIIDPVDPKRNAAAALGEGALEIFKKAADNFLKHPSVKHFEKEKINLQTLKKKAGKRKLIIIKITTKKQKEDVIGGRLARLFRRLQAELSRNDFRAEGGFSVDDEKLIWFFTDRAPLKPNYEIRGPPEKLELHAQSFRKSHKKVYSRKGKLYASVKRRFTKPEALVRELLKDKEIAKIAQRAAVRVC